MTTPSIPPAVPDEQVGRARRAQEAWAGEGVRRRLGPVRALRHLLVSEVDVLCRAVAQDVGKSAEEVVGGEVLPLAEACRFLEREAERVLRPRRVARGLRPLWLFGQRDTVHRRPRGLVGVIGTWNYPVFLNGVQLAQALTAGNGVLWKPSELAPRSAEVLHDLLGRAGYPPELIRRLPATREAGAALLEAAVDHVVFTGSAATGRKVAARLGERLVSSTLELSGCDAQFVLDDADVALAARAAWFGATANSGQTCIAVRRAFVQRGVYDAFCAALKDLASSAGPLALALPAQAEQAGRLVREAVAEGGRLLAPRSAAEVGEGGCRPAVVADARPGMALCREASFAPVLAVLPFDGVEEALAMEAECGYALGASVFTGRAERAGPIAARVRAGMVAVNDVIVPTAHPATPFGGRGRSGWGVTQGAEGLLEMTVPQAVSVRAGTYRPHYDPAAGQGELLRGLLEAGHAPGWGQRWRGWRRLLGAAWRQWGAGKVSREARRGAGELARSAARRG
jgi:acyl-CoA reductase-like NAD-dependent aldehyde dehydrogenase